jgi:hypothetical protein
VLKRGKTKTCQPCCYARWTVNLSGTTPAPLLLDTYAQPNLCRYDTEGHGAYGKGSASLATEDTSWNDRLRHARDAQATHLDAVLRVNGAQFLRLSHLFELLKTPDTVDMLELKAEQGVEPTLWLGLNHRIRMEPDAKTYRLTHIGEGLQTLLETTDVNDMRNASQNVLSHVQHQKLASTTKPTPPAEKTAVLRNMTLVYIWLTGVVTGAAIWGLASIYL